MAEAETVAVQPRTVMGKKVGRLRREGIIPGVLAGHGDSTPVQTERHAFELGYRRWGGTSLLSLEGLPGGAAPALIHHVSRHPVTGRMVHIDFQRVSLTEKAHAEVPLHYVGECPAVKNSGAVLLHAMDRISIEAFPQDIPRRIDIDLSALVEIDDSLHVRDIRVDATKVRILDDPDELVVKAQAARVEEAVAPKGATAAAGAEGEAEGDEEAEGEKAEKGKDKK